MARKPFLKRTLATFFLVSVLYAHFNAFLHHVDSSTLDSAAFPFNFATASSVLLAAGASKSPVVKVYLYDLPCRSPYRVVHHHSLARGYAPTKTMCLPSSIPATSTWQSGTFFDLSRLDSERAGSPVVWVLYPDEVDLFCVSFFSSLSLIVNPVWPALERHNSGINALALSSDESVLYSDFWGM